MKLKSVLSYTGFLAALILSPSSSHAAGEAVKIQTPKLEIPEGTYEESASNIILRGKILPGSLVRVGFQNGKPISVKELEAEVKKLRDIDAKEIPAYCVVEFTFQPSEEGSKTAIINKQNISNLRLMHSLSAGIGQFEILRKDPNAEMTADEITTARKYVTYEVSHSDRSVLTGKILAISLVQHLQITPDLNHAPIVEFAVDGLVSLNPSHPTAPSPKITEEIQKQLAPEAIETSGESAPAAVDAKPQK